ncbi:fibronectin type 3 and ankyrin repeat domains protein 1 isoform X2 [Protopterus annectens]|uniref:fibronectin type 3 and ankyrin repeat domains protein 1 isoform X2 n=1 Tax=Protopterus annectens TaxID=7888 RepID=UPI001CFB99E5|nr:fibronectin type 3 and ankyrin repeat domains protein 1 isoform X2 [Protopterus annectens]
MASAYEFEDTYKLKPDPPVVGKVSHHSVELYWDPSDKLQKVCHPDKRLRFSVEEEDPQTHRYGIVYVGYGKCHVVEGLEPNSVYKFRLKVTSSSGDYSYSPVLSVSTTREPLNGEHLHRAVNRNDEKAVVQILQSGQVNVDVPNKLGYTPLMVASQQGYLSLMLACFAGHLDIIKHLRKYGVSWNTTDFGGSTPMHWAADGGHCKVVQYLISDGCKVDVKDNGSLWTPLMRVSAVSGNVDAASSLIQAGANVNAKDKDGKTPLMVAVLNNHEPLVRLLLAKGADLTVTNEYGIGILQMAKALGRQNIIPLLESANKKIRICRKDENDLRMKIPIPY